MQTNISFKIDTADKRRFEDFCAAVGLNVSGALSLFVKAVLNEGRIPFPIAAPGLPYGRTPAEIDAALLAAEKHPAGECALTSEDVHQSALRAIGHV